METVSAGLGIDLLPPEPVANSLGHLMIGRMDDVEKAIELVRIDVWNDPASADACDRLAEAT